MTQSQLLVPAWKAQVESLQDDYRYCREIMIGASKNYSFASKFLPREKRHHVEAFYAFLRVGDDRVDVSHENFPSKRAAIEDWEHTYWDAFETGSSAHPVMRAFLHTALKFEIPPEIMIPYFRAMKEDLSITRFETFSDLVHYMEGSAMTVGRGMTYILGIKPQHTMAQVLPYADALSIAMQLSNFWRDIQYDWTIGRVYIPQEDMQRFGVSEDDLSHKKLTPQFLNLMRFELQRTEDYYQKARLGVPMLASGRWGVLAGLEIYRAILESIRRNQYDIFSQRAGAPRLEKMRLAAYAWLRTRGL